jgi:hypothetical protein
MTPDDIADLQAAIRRAEALKKEIDGVDSPDLQMHITEILKILRHRQAKRHRNERRRDR